VAPAHASHAPFYMSPCQWRWSSPFMGWQVSFSN